MTTKKNNTSGTIPEKTDLVDLCDKIVEFEFPWEDVSALIEDRTYALCVGDSYDIAITQLKRLTVFFESMKDKNEENCRDLADIYILIGEVEQYVGKFAESIEWFRNAAIVFDRSALPYHNLATSYYELGDMPAAIKSLVQEIELEPGNYYSRIRLADLYEQQGEIDKEEQCLNDLLVRDPHNIQALHKLIVHYEKHQPKVGVQLLRKRLVAVKKNFSELEMVIRVYHLLCEKLQGEALEFVNAQLVANPAMTILYLLRAFIFGELHQFSRKRKELAEFKQHCLGKKEFMQSKLDEFEHVFGNKAVARLGRILVLSNPFVLQTDC